MSRRRNNRLFSSHAIIILLSPLLQTITSHGTWDNHVKLMQQRPQHHHHHHHHWLVGSLWPKTEFDGEPKMQIGSSISSMITWPIPLGFSKLVLKFPHRNFFTMTIFANCLERTALVPGQKHYWQKMWFILLLLEKRWLDHPLTLTLENRWWLDQW